MRLIDADALSEKVCETTIFIKDGEVFQRMIHDAPTIDAVPVVRCKDCRHANECHKSVQYTRNEPNTVTIGYSPIEWCSRGERREK